MGKGKDLQSQEIDALLQELGKELVTRGFIDEPVRVLLVGGAYMALIAGQRRTTQDIDVFPLNYPNSASPNEKTKRVLTAIKAVARRNGLKGDWMNDSVSGILGELQPGEEQLQMWRSYGALNILIPPPDFILMTKLIGYRDKDFRDVEALLAQLQITTRLQAINVMYKYGVDDEALAEYYVHDTLDNFFDD